MCEIGSNFLYRGAGVVILFSWRRGDTAVSVFLMRRKKVIGAPSCFKPEKDKRMKKMDFFLYDTGWTRSASIASGAIPRRPPVIAPGFSETAYRPGNHGMEDARNDFLSLAGKK
jgi:hypothetical protein